MHWRNAKSKMAPTIAVTALVAVTLAALLCQHAVQGGIIVKRQALSAEEELTTVAPPATTVATIEEREETSTEAAPTTRTISFERDVEGLTKEIEFGYDSENREASGEQASVAELTRVDPTAVTTEVPIEEEEEVATTVPPVIASAELVDNSVTARSNANDISAELEATTTVATTDDVPTTVVPAASGEEVVEAQSDVGSGVVEFQTEGRHAVIDVEQFKSVEEASLPRFELERYTSASNFSQGGISLEDSRAERDQFFATTPSSLLPEPTTTTTESLEPSDSVTQLVFTENNEVLVPEGTNHTIERNSTVRVEQREVESTDYEVVSNEVRNQTLVKGGKKGKFLDQFGATEDNDINGAVWALAGMRMVDRASSKVGEATEGSVEVVRDENENVVANNTLKQLMDWAAIMQAADFANTSFVRPTSGEVVDLKSELKDRRKYGNRTPGELDAASEENRITSVVTEVVPEASVEVTTVVAPKVEVSSTTEAAGDDDLEDFKFEDRSKVMTTKRPELTNFIQETTTVFNVRTEEAMTTMRPTRNYEVSENVDETEKFALPGRTTTTGRSEISTTFEDIPVTTYSPASPVAKRTDATTESLIPTTFESMRAVITRRPAVTTTQEPRSAEETTLLMTTMITTTTTTVAPTTTNGANEPVVNDQDNGSSEIDVNSVNQTNNEIVMITTTTTESADSIIPQQSTVLPTVVEFRPSQETTDTSSPSEQSEEQPTVPNQPVQVDDKSVYDTVSETTLSPVPEPEPSAAPEPEPTASEPAVTSTRRSIERQMTTEVLSEEESVTEEDYVELNASTVANANSSKSPLDQNATEPTAEQEEEGSGVVVAVVTSLVVVIVVLLLIAAYLIFRKRQAQVSYGQRCRPVGLDAYSLDNVSVYNSVRRGKGNTMRMSKRSYGNSAFEDPGLKTNPLTVAELANIIQNKTAIYDEFKEIPNVTARADEVPEGCEDKNRYANVVPLPETRVHLKRINDDEKTEYINANFVKGPKDSSNYYIACQAPMENTINDFWRMIWEQNSKVIIMATDLSENGVEKCAEYLPPSVVLDNNRTFGDFQLTLKNRENKEKYTISTVHLRNTQTNTWREIMHFWYQWPDTGVPIDESSIIAMLLEARSYSRLAPAEMAETTTPAATNTNTNATSNGGRDTLGMGMAMGMNGITSIAEEDSTSQLDSSLVSSLNVDSSNNNVVGGKTASEPPSSIMTNGTNTMDKHKSLQRTQGPITMHCSPGTGRTGTIIACDVALRAVEIPPRNVDVPHIVYYVRRGRASAVRTREQYELIYRVANVYATKLTGPTIET
uniref:Tyrosine-protein phosphatase non-receptor type 9 n=1 Tax=Culex pipiens TaxID=7175 RepID=A0A8D8B2B7_CULPI